MPTRFARTSKGVLGKYDTKVDSFKFYQEAKDRLQARAAANGMELSEYLRHICLVDAYGVDHLTNIHRRQYQSVRTKDEKSSNGAE